MIPRAELGLREPAEKKQPTTPAPDQTPETEEGETHSGGGEVLVCVSCEHPITRSGERIEVAGQVEHSFVNPHAIMFHISCFALAPGCVGQGPSSTDWSWFPGYAWQVLLCRGCLRHLGWSFSSTDRGFYGLISDRLKEQETENPTDHV